MKIPSVNQYKKAVETLSAPSVELLKALYYQPNSSADGKTLARVMKWKSQNASNLNIGRIGKNIATALNWEPDLYTDRGEYREGFFWMIGKHYTDTGWVMYDNLQKALEELKLVVPNRKKKPSREAEDLKNVLKEGRVKEITLDRYERDAKARAMCLDHYGNRCFVCGLDFGEVYGAVAEGFIHVHHIMPLSAVKRSHKVDPIKDMRPVCPNCHAVIHLEDPPLSIARVKRMLERSNKL